MSREVLRTDRAPISPLYAQGVKHGPHVFVSGMVGIDPARGELAGPTIQEQTIQSLTNCFAVLEAGGVGIDEVVEVGVLLANPDDFSGMNEAYAIGVRSRSSCPVCREAGGRTSWRSGVDSDDRDDLALARRPVA